MSASYLNAAFVSRHVTRFRRYVGVVGVLDGVALSRVSFLCWGWRSALGFGAFHLHFFVLGDGVR
jgi:hypothetical protein